MLGNHVGIAGGTSNGIITKDYIGYEGFHAGIMIISSEDISFSSIMVAALKHGEFKAGKRAGEKISDSLKHKNANLLFSMTLSGQLPT